MRKTLLDRLICPLCLQRDRAEKPLTLDVREENESEVLAGTLHCAVCGSDYAIEEGIAQLLVPEMIAEQRTHTEAWEALAGREEWLAPSDDYLDALPFPVARELAPGDTITWDRHCRNYFRVLSELELQGREVLDLGTGRCWSSKYLALGGACVTATDLMAHPALGLGAGAVLMRRHPVYFERVCCDMNCLPFASASFDGVFVSGSLHHTPDLAAACNEAGRVCRDGGWFAMTNEPCNGWRAGREHGDDDDGTSEHNYRTWRQLRALRRAGFRNLRVLPDAYFSKADDYCYSRFFDLLSRVSRVAFYLKPLLLGGVLLLTARRAPRPSGAPPCP